LSSEQVYFWKLKARSVLAKVKLYCENKEMQKKTKQLIFILALGLFICLGFLDLKAKELNVEYQKRESAKILDRNGDLFFLKRNSEGYFSQYLTETPQELKGLVLEQEDHWFFWHFGLNPVSMLKNLISNIGLSKRSSSSTLTQQTAKILLKNENQRTFKNKIKEIFYVLALEIRFSKEEILLMYLNSAYLGNNLQGFETASQAYFKKTAGLLTKEETSLLLASLSSPSSQNPLTLKNTENTPSQKEIYQNFLEYTSQKPETLELNEFPEVTSFTLDKVLNEKIREIIYRNLENLSLKKAKNGAAVVLLLPENEILALIGSPQPFSFEEGMQINMAPVKRAAGSTIKPFIYLKAFEKGLRPYTLIDDKEYKYYTEFGFPFYPKNYDNKYRGLVSAHYALSNSINVVALKALEFVGVKEFSDFLTKTLKLQTTQKIESYQLGIALGSLETSLLELSRIFSIFPNEGVLKNLKIAQNEKNTEQKVANKEFIALVNKILSDRKTSQDQFSYQSPLNLPFSNYGLKTGTSQNYKDSWVVGYTSDFLVAVWVGNANNTKTEGLSGQEGAGLIWSEIMELMFTSKYNQKREFDFSLIKEFQDNNSIEFGLENDNFEKLKNLFIK